MARKLFVSYSHADEPERPRDGEVQWLTFVLGYLRAALRGAEVEIFTDRGLAGGADWEPEIERHLRACDAFVLLASPNSLNSTYVVEKEIAVVRAREKAGDGPLFLPILMAPTPEAALDLVRGKNWRPRGDKTLWEYPPPERARLMTEAADELARELKGREPAALEIKDRETLRVWLEGQPREVGVTIAARAALRALPMYRLSFDRRGLLSNSMSSLFRATACSRVAAKYPVRTRALSAAASAAAADATSAANASAFVGAAAAAVAAANAAIAGAEADVAATVWQASEAAASAAAALAGPTIAHAGDAAAWQSVTSDVERLLRGSASSLADAPLWPEGLPARVSGTWADMRAGLPSGADWEVWFDWYAERLRGVSRGEAYEMTFATVPVDVSEQGAKAANAWIRDHLPEIPPPPAPADLTQAVEGVESPTDYDWDAVAQQIRLSFNSANLPLFLLDSGAEDHAQTLAACRAEAERLLKALKANKHNVRSEYAEDVEAYLGALPASAEQGAILPAYNLVLALRDNLREDWDNAPARFRNDLKRLIDSNFALFRFYDAIERHNRAIADSQQVETLPKAPVRAFVQAVGQSSVFAGEVAEGLRGVEALGPKTEPAPALNGDAPPASLVPAPPLTPTAAQSADRQKAGAINALWKVFLEGPKVVGATDGWIDFARKGGEAVKPILEWLARSQSS